MVGKYDIKVGNNVVEFEFTLKRKYTIMFGETGSGKSLLSTLINHYYLDTENGSALRQYPDVYIKSELCFRCIDNVTTLKDECSRDYVDVIILDEWAFVKSNEFKAITEFANQYFIIISRESFDGIPYSMYEIYDFVEYKQTKGKVFKRAINVYTDTLKLWFRPELIITEDKKSGYTLLNECNKSENRDMFGFFADNCKVVSSDGKSNICDTLREYLNKSNNIFVMLDSAAFGAQASKLQNLLDSSVLRGKSLCIFTPESFEYLILKSGIMKRFNINKELNETYNYAETKKHISWEAYYERLMIDLTQNGKRGVAQYTKDLPLYYVRNGKFIIDVIKEMA